MCLYFGVGDEDREKKREGEKRNGKIQKGGKKRKHTLGKKNLN